MASEPSPLQLALALTLNRSKPRNVSVREYILALRQHIHPGRRPQFSATYEESQNNYINAALYFESLLKDEQKANEKLRNRVALLERQSLGVDDVISEGGIGEKKRKRDGSKNQRKKKAKSGNNDDPGEVLHNFQQPGIIGFHTTEVTEGATLLRRIYSLQASLQDTSSRPQRISRCLSQVCAAFVSILKCKPGQGDDHPQANRTAGENFTTAQVRVLSLVFRGFNALVNSSNEPLSNSTAGKEPANPCVSAIYAVLSLFQAILLALDDAVDCKTQLTKASNHEPQRRPAKACKKTKSADETPARIGHLGRLARTFVTLVTSPSTDDDPQRQLSRAYAELQEGTLYALLVRSGALLYKSTFSTARSSSIAAEIASNATTVSPEPSDSSNGDENDPSLELKGQHLLSLLRLILPQHRIAAESDGTELEGNGPSTSQRPCPDLVAKPLRVLQNTLVSGIFGPSSGEASCLDDDIFGEVLHFPASSAEGARMENDDDCAEATDAPACFAQELWEMVGWDVLARGFDTAGQPPDSPQSCSR